MHVAVWHCFKKNNHDYKALIQTVIENIHWAAFPMGCDMLRFSQSPLLANNFVYCYAHNIGSVQH